MLIELYPLILSMFTICLKFQLTKKSARLIVANAMCKQSAQLVCPTTFSVIYSVAKSIASSVVSINSVKSALRLFTSTFTLSGAFSSSSCVTVKYRIMNSPSLILLNRGIVCSLNSSLKCPPKTEVYVNSFFHFYCFLIVHKNTNYMCSASLIVCWPYLLALYIIGSDGGTSPRPDLVVLSRTCPECSRRIDKPISRIKLDIRIRKQLLKPRNWEGSTFRNRGSVWPEYTPIIENAHNRRGQHGHKPQFRGAPLWLSLRC